MAQRPDVSIIVAAFNAEQYIGQALASALSQSGVSLEVIVADDASTDRTAEFVREMHDERLHLITLAANVGPGGARNAALAIARGEWVAVLDADDWVAPGRLAKLVALGREAGADLIADNLWVDQDGERTLLIGETLDDGWNAIDLASYVLDNRPTEPGLGLGYLKPVFRAAFLERCSLRYDPALRIGEDFILVAEALAQGALFVRQRSASYVYRKHPGSISHRLDSNAADAMVVADERFIAQYGPRATPASNAAMRSHLASVKNAAAFARFVDAIKRRRWAAAAAHAAQRPAVLALLKAAIKVRLAKLGLPTERRPMSRTLSIGG